MEVSCASFVCSCVLFLLCPVFRVIFLIPLLLSIASFRPHLAEMGRQMQENDPVAFEDLRRRAAAQFAATHDDEPTPRERDQDK